MENGFSEFRQSRKHPARARRRLHQEIPRDYSALLTKRSSSAKLDYFPASSQPTKQRVSLVNLKKGKSSEVRGGRETSPRHEVDEL
jgi:hypothetical protein